METLHKYLLSLIRKHFHGSVKITFKNGLPVSIKEEKSIDTTIFKEEIREKLGQDWS
ncbi:MAG: hypothetical protein Q8O30_01010 [Candidatus Omnitrophota bacterium]|nr:hypothetical protein [Candidatus Omnitrophota bacterium]